MDRKKTILIAVMINAGLLAVLFIAALTTQEEIVIQHSEMAENPYPTQTHPLFNEPIDLAPKSEAPKSETTLAELPLLQLPILENSSPKSEEPVHKLPAYVQETPPKPQPVVSMPEKDFSEVKVKKGDTLEKIARHHHTSVDAIIKKNKLPSSFLRIGQVLKVPTEKTLATAPKLKPAPPIERTAGPEYYTVKVGDNPWTIAMKHHMKVNELLRLNSLNEEKARKLKPGDRLRIR